jgi:hypothetical protein
MLRMFVHSTNFQLHNTNVRCCNEYKTIKIFTNALLDPVSEDPCHFSTITIMKIALSLSFNQMNSVGDYNNTMSLCVTCSVTPIVLLITLLTELTCVATS